MELNDIITLVKAGYTKDEIAQMATQATPDANTEPVQTAVSNVTPEAEPIPEQVEQPTAVPTVTGVQTEKQPTMEDILQSIAKLTSAVQANAIAQSVMPNGISNPPKAEDMLAEIIRPTIKERM